ncbi:phage holin family protein [Arsenophonus nasoniae]|uniref:Phage holin family protein n=1 Tax=Arsenophonus nasoniae TaxID=638 RepID=A0AA95GIV6_9GAMM|nr:phage holin family protein [Arsenophonus nasoniae]WGL96664.1 phage holin family protein [Arsenophonus nasoniae]
MLNKEPSFAFYQWLILLLLSAWGGFVRYLIQVKNNEAELGWLNGLGQIIVSGFTGLLGGFLSLEIGLSTYMTFFAAGVCGAMGSVALSYFWQRFTGPVGGKHG